MNTVLIIMSVVTGFIASYVVSALSWMARKNEFKTYKKKLEDFEESKKRITEDIENDRKRFE